MALAGLGTVLALYLGSCQVAIGSRAEIIGHHVHYRCPYPPALSLASSIAYGAATVLPAVLSSVARMWMLGVAIAASYVMTVIYYDYFTISVWCYFAAVLSSIVVWILVTMHRPASAWRAHAAADS